MRGVDRVTESLDLSIATWMSLDSPFHGGDNLWNSFQYGLEEYIDANGGLATVQPYVTNRPNWEDVKEVLLGNRPISDLGCN